MSRARGGRSFLATAGEAARLGGDDRDKGAAACVAACRDNQHSRQQTERYLATNCTVTVHPLQALVGIRARAGLILLVPHCAWRRVWRMA
jgi:hypothetical protein